jgi:hypothetical protein
MAERIKAFCIEGYCVGAAALDETQRAEIGALDRDGDGFVSLYLATPAGDEGAWVTAHDDPEILAPPGQITIDISAATPQALGFARQFLRYRMIADAGGRQRFHLYHMPADEGVRASTSAAVAAELPQALADLRLVGMFPAESESDIAILLRHATPPMRLEARPAFAFAGKCHSPAGMSVVGLTYEYLSASPFFKTLKHELAHTSLHLSDQSAPRWLSEAIASHAENYDPATGPLERLALPSQLRGQWAMPFERWTWDRRDWAGEYERYQICHAFFLFIEHRSALAAIHRLYDILRTRRISAMEALLLVTGAASIRHLERQFRLWLADQLTLRRRDAARLRQSARRTAAGTPRRSGAVVHRIEDGAFVAPLRNPMEGLAAGAQLFLRNARPAPRSFIAPWSSMSADASPRRQELTPFWR